MDFEKLTAEEKVYLAAYSEEELNEAKAMQDNVLRMGGESSKQRYSGFQGFKLILDMNRARDEKDGPYTVVYRKKGSNFDEKKPYKLYADAKRHVDTTFGLQHQEIKNGAGRVVYFRPDYG